MTKKCFSMVLVMFVLLGLSACKQEVPDDSYADPLSHDTLYYDTATSMLTFSAVYNSASATSGSWHLIVHKDGAAGGSTVTPFSTGVSPHQFYQGLLLLGAEAGDNVTPENMALEGIFTEGSLLEITITWDGAAKTYEYSELFEEHIPYNSTLQEELGMEIRFGGRRSNEDTESPPSDKTGCLICQYACPTGVASSAKADSYIRVNHDGNAYRYFANPDVVPADGTVCTINVKVVK